VRATPKGVAHRWSLNDFAHTHLLNYVDTFDARGQYDLAVLSRQTAVSALGGAHITAPPHEKSPSSPLTVELMTVELRNLSLPSDIKP
jgi:hypothetical protein